MTKHVDFARLEAEWGIIPLAQDWLPPEFRRDIRLACDAQPALLTQPSSGVPAILTTFFDPDPVRVLQAPNNGAEIIGERKEGDWNRQTAMFMVVENTGEVSSYGDYNEYGKSDANVNFPQRQSYHYQTIIEYGDRETDTMSLTALNWVAEKQTSAAKTLNKFQDLTYHFGVAGLQNYGLLNDPALSPAITPTTKQAGGTKWVSSNGAVVATANEVVIDVQALFSTLVAQTNGLVNRKSNLTLAMAPQSDVGILAINSFGNDVTTLLSKGFPNLKVVTSPRYATPAGNIVQLIADDLDGNDTGFCAFTEKLRAGRIVPRLSSFAQKYTGGTWGAVWRYPMAVATMLGV